DKAGLEWSWGVVSLLLMAGHFGVPFFFLMGRAVKRKALTLALGGVWLLAMHFMDLYWQVMPTLHPEGVRPALLDVAAFVAIGGGVVCAVGWVVRGGGGRAPPGPPAARSLRLLGRSGVVWRAKAGPV